MSTKTLCTKCSSPLPIIPLLSQILSILKIPCPECKRHVELHQNDLSKARVLAADVLSTIFLLTLPPTSSREVQFGTSIEGSEPWILSQVCRSWRAVAFTTPTLWTGFPCFQITSDMPNSDSGTGGLLRKSLTMFPSTQFPINISLDHHEPGSGSRENLVTQVLLPHSNRFDHLYISSLSKDIESFFACVKGNLASLKSLSLHITRTNVGYVEPPSSPISAFAHAPLLDDFTYFSTKLFSWRNLQNWILLPWSQLQRFSATMIDPSSIILILSTAKALKECQINNCTIPDKGHPIWSSAVQQMPSIPSVTNTSVSMFYLCSLEVSDLAEHILSHLTLPSLRKLSLSVQNIAVAPINGFISRSSCTLTFFELESRFGCTGDLAGLLALLPAVTNLHIPIMPDIFSTILSTCEGHPLPFPARGQHLYLTIPEGSEGDVLYAYDSEPTIADLRSRYRTKLSAIVSRLRKAIPYETVIVAGNGPMHETFYTLDGRSKDSVDRGLLSTWDTILEEICKTARSGWVTTKVDALMKVLSEIEAHPHIDTCYLRNALIRCYTLPDVLSLIPDGMAIVRYRIEAILEKWASSVDASLHEVGWMETELSWVLVHAQRRGSLRLQRRERSKYRFAPFNVENGFVTV
ncbi:unnamed protein product [Cyclocybe aegerita]|uniref:F-box domain-containing protein n=1 Tax=Cyclocybe aegerita TaxID=1973307 RepID=A0A8S0WBX6_CYCAE|nr:unnamed protein product [Cyclocybe aegerita]